MPPYWFVFDLDETLTHMNPYFPIICSFFTEEVAKEAGRPNLASARTELLNGPLQTAYETFVNKVAQAELSSEPLGVVRPGMLELFTEIARLKDAGLAGGAFIYSNNGTMRILKFVADVIHAALGRKDIFCDYSHLRDKRRTPEGRLKTFRRIQNIIQTGPCGPVAPPAPNAEDVFFFDDTIHEDILYAIGGNYIQVYPYTYKVNTARMRDLYIESLQEAGVLDNGELQAAFYRFAQPACFSGLKPTNNANALKTLIQKAMGGPGASSLPPMDTSLDGILARLRAMGAAPPVANNGLGNNPLNAIQTAGRRRRRSSKTKKANRKNRRNNRTKWRRQRA